MISIIITTYNRGKELNRLLQSIYSQTFKNYEIILIDDNSNTTNYNIIKNQILLNKNNIKFIRNKKNIGYALSCIKGLNLSTKKFVIFLSDDDYLVNNTFFEKAMKMFDEDKSIDSVFGRCETESKGKIVLNKYPFKRVYNTKDFIDEIIKLRFSFLDYFSFSSFIFKTEIFKKIKPFDSIYSRAGSVDISNIIKYLLISKKVGFVDVTAYRWIKSRESSLSGEKKDDLVYQTLQSVSAAIDIYNFFDDKSICKRVCNEYIKYIFNAILSDYEQLKNKENFEKLLRKLQRKNISEVYIYCRGWVGLELKEFLEKNKIKVKKFIDDYKIKFDDTINFKKFTEIKESKFVIIASYKYKDIYLIFKKLNKLNNIEIFDLI